MAHANNTFHFRISARRSKRVQSLTTARERLHAGSWSGGNDGDDSRSVFLLYRSGRTERIKVVASKNKKWSGRPYTRPITKYIQNFDFTFTLQQSLVGTQRTREHTQRRGAQAAARQEHTCMTLDTAQWFIRWGDLCEAEGAAAGG